LKCSFPEGISFRPDGIHELDPCLYELIEEYENVTVQVNRCTKCGHIEITWKKQEDTVCTYTETDVC